MPVTIEKKNKKTGQVTRKVYETVAERVRKFRAVHPIAEGWAIRTEIKMPDDKTVMAIARVLTPEGFEVASGTAEEKRDTNFINTTSAIENAETSAIGRCLFTAGYGGGEFCSSNELLVALKNQERLKEAELKVVQGSGKPQATKTVDKTSGPPNLEGITYRREADVIIAEGNTFAMKGLLKNAGFRWNPDLKAWALEVKNA